MKSSSTQRSLTQFKQLCKKAQGLQDQPAKKLKVLRTEIQSRFLHLSQFIKRRTLLRAMAAAGMVMTLGVSQVQAQAQVPSFSAGVTNPFNVNPVGSYSTPTLVDIDGDSDLDIIAGDADGGFFFYENNGTVTAPNFNTPVTTPFGLDTLPGTTNGFPFITAGDLDGDGDFDIMRGDTEYGNLWYYQNTGTATAPAFGVPVSNPFGITALDEYTAPSFADMDNDGDLDLLVGDDYGKLEYYQNTGTATAPAFTAPVTDPFGWVNPNQFMTIGAADLDMDGDIDVMGNSYGTWRYYENTGTAIAPSFSVTANPFGLTASQTILNTAFGDLDDDGDLDILSGVYTSTTSSEFIYFENSPLVGIGQEVIGENGWSLYPNPSRETLYLKKSADLPAGQEEMEIFDLQGRIVAVQSLGESFEAQSINLNGLTPGHYTIRISGAAGVSRLRFVKQ